MILYAIVALALAALFGGIYWSGDRHGHEAQVAVDQPVIDKLKAQEVLAVVTNGQLKAANDEARKLADACGVTVKALGTVGSQAKDAVDKAIAESRQRSARFESQLQRYLAGSEAPAAGTRTEQCDAADRVLSELADSMRGDQPQTGPIVPTADPIRPNAAQPVTKPLPPVIRRKPK